MKKILVVLTLGLAFAVLFTSQLGALVIKMGSIAPEQSPWGEALNKLAAEWKALSGGRVELKIYHNSVLGSESDMIRKMRFGQIQAGVFSSFGLNEITPEVLTLSMPMLIHTDDELDYVLNKIKPTLAKKMEEKNFKILAWSRVGWVRFFGRKPIVYPADLKAQKLASNPDDQALMQAWKLMGYQQVPVAIPDVLSSLNSGMIEAVYASPIAVGGFQWFGLAKYMSSLKVSPFVGGIVINEATWAKIPEDIKPAMLKSLAKLEKDLDKNIRSLEDDAIKQMKQYGLVVVDVPAEAEAEWKKESQNSYHLILGKSFSKEMYEEIKKDLEEYHKK